MGDKGALEMWELWTLQLWPQNPFPLSLMLVAWGHGGGWRGGRWAPWMGSTLLGDAFVEVGRV